MQKIILGIDPGLVRTGWGIVNYNSNKLSFVACGTISPPPPAEMPTRILFIFENVKKILQKYKPNEMAIENIFMSKNADSALKLGQARAACLLAVAIKKIAISEYAPNTIKKSLVGQGHSTKNQIEHMVGHLLPKASWKYKDEADALAIAICHAHHT